MYFDTYKVGLNFRLFVDRNLRTSDAPLISRGYTGHEHLDRFGLINMNGRLYDPVLGRVLSPDNYVQDPLFSQNYNRYSYCFNNPLKYIDPSGEITGGYFFPWFWGVFSDLILGTKYQSRNNYVPKNKSNDDFFDGSITIEVHEFTHQLWDDEINVEVKVPYNGGSGGGGGGSIVQDDIYKNIAPPFRYPKYNGLQNEKPIKKNDNLDQIFAKTVSTLEGKVYKLGGKGPNEYDCSATVWYGIKAINPNFPYNTAQDLFNNYTIPTDKLEPGTLIFYDWGQGTIDGIKHVVTIINDSEIIHGSSKAKKIVKVGIHSLDKITENEKFYYRKLNWNLIINKSL